jgi:hypothetical protein
MDGASHRPTAASVPEPVAYVRDLLLGFARPWLLCGGWAADAWLGRQTRDHFDVDIAVFHHDQAAVFAHLPGWALVGHDPNVPDETTEPWNGRPLDPPAHIHVPERGSPLSTSATAHHTAFEFEFLLNEATDDHWILNRDRDITVPLDQAIRTSPWGLPTAAPEVVLFFKGGGNHRAAGPPAVRMFRPRDEQDFFALLPTLTAGRRSWLRESLRRADPDHPWSAHLAS